MKTIILAVVLFAGLAEAQSQFAVSQLPERQSISKQIKLGSRNLEIDAKVPPSKTKLTRLEEAISSPELNSPRKMKQLLSGGSEGTGGGDSDAQIAKAIISRTFQKLHAAYGSSITVNDVFVNLDFIASFIGSTRVEAVKGPLLKNGKPVDALNYPGRNLIEIDKEKFKNAHAYTVRRLMIHEVLGLAKIDDSTYGLSVAIDKEYNLLFTLNSFPLDSGFQEAHQAWAQSHFTDLAEAIEFINAKEFSCSWIAWTAPGVGRRANPNQWLTRPGVIPKAQVNQNPLGQTVSIGMNINFNGSTAGPAILKNGKIETVFTFYDGSKSKAIAGKAGNRLFIKLRDFQYETTMDFENINVCQ